MKKLLEAIKAPDSVTVTARERLVLKMVRHVELDREFIVKQSMYNAVSDSVYGRDIARTNLVHRMANIVRKRMKGKVNGVNRFEQGTLFIDVAQQLYWLDQAEESPLISEYKSYGYDGEIKYNVKPNFIPLDLTLKKNNKEDDEERKLPLFTRCRDTIYRPGHGIGRPWVRFSSDLSDMVLTIGRYSKDVLMKLYTASSDYNDTERKESQVDRYIRAEEAIDYIHDHVCGKPLVFSAVPDSRTRVSKYRIFFADSNEELDVRYTWFINFYGEGWQTALYELYDMYELDEDGMEDLRVAMARQWRKKNGHGRTSWKKANNMFAKHSKEIIEHCLKDFSHGLYYPRMSRLYKNGVGTMTGFLIEADLSASGIGTAAMCVRSKKMAQRTALAGSATPADAHRSIVEKILFSVMNNKEAHELIEKHYKIIKKKNTEVTHAQTIDVTASSWNELLDKLGATHQEVTSELVRKVYDEEMPGMLQWIEAITSITEPGVNKGFPVLYFYAPDGAKCATSAFSESRIFQSRAVDADLKSKTMKFQMRMPIEVHNKRIVWKDYAHDGEIIKNKLMGAWANFIQAEDAYGMRMISRSFKAKHNYVPIVKHDGYHVKLGHVKSLAEDVYEWRVYQFKEQPIKKYFESIADFLNIKRIELPEGDMKLSDLKFKCVGEAPFIMT